MSFAVYKLYWDPSNDNNEGHVALYVETGEETVFRMENGRRVPEKVQNGLMFHATDGRKKIVKDGNTELVQFEFQKKAFTPVRSLNLSKMSAIGKLKIGHLNTLETIAESVQHPRRPLPYTTTSKRPNCATWYEDFVQKLADGMVVSFSGKEEIVDRFKPRKIMSRSASGSSSASGHNRKLRNLLKRK